MDEFEEIIERIRAAHLRWPSLRLCQLICNVSGELYYISDAEFLKSIQIYLEDN
jgi:hypothetical protein